MWFYVCFSLIALAIFVLIIINFKVYFFDNKQKEVEKNVINNFFGYGYLDFKYRRFVLNEKDSNRQIAFSFNHLLDETRVILISQGEKDFFKKLLVEILEDNNDNLKKDLLLKRLNDNQNFIYIKSDFFNEKKAFLKINFSTNLNKDKNVFFVINGIAYHNKLDIELYNRYFPVVQSQETFFNKNLKIKKDLNSSLTFISLYQKNITIDDFQNNFHLNLILRAFIYFLQKEKRIEFKFIRVENYNEILIIASKNINSNFLINNNYWNIKLQKLFVEFCDKNNLIFNFKNLFSVASISSVGNLNSHLSNFAFLRIYQINQLENETKTIDLENIKSYSEQLINYYNSINEETKKGNFVNKEFIVDKNQTFYFQPYYDVILHNNLKFIFPKYYEELMKLFFDKLVKTKFGIQDSKIKVLISINDYEFFKKNNQKYKNIEWNFEITNEILPSFFVNQFSYNFKNTFEVNLLINNTNFEEKLFYSLNPRKIILSKSFYDNKNWNLQIKIKVEEIKKFIKSKNIELIFYE